MGILRLVLAFGVLISPASWAGEFTSLAEARQVTDRFVDMFAEEKIVDAYNSLKPYWPLPAVEIDNLANQTQLQWPVIRQRFGATVGKEFVEQLNGGPSLARFIYLQKFQNHAIRWIFTFYKPVDKWVVNSVSFDDQLALLF